MQYVDKETYKRFVDSCGIEHAYKMRFRGTGRTVRDILRLTLALSEGKTIEIHTTNSPGKTRHFAEDVLRRVGKLASEFGMEICGRNDAIACLNSGGTIRIFSACVDRRGERIPHEMEIYELHDS